MAVVIGILLLIFISALFAVPGAFILMLLLGALAHITSWHCNLSFLACYIIVVIIALFVPKPSKSS